VSPLFYCFPALFESKMHREPVMQRLILISLLFFTLTLTACQSTGSYVTVPSPRNLEGLEGEWYYHVTFRGRLDNWYKSDDVYEQQSGDLFFTTNTILDKYDNELGWWYDGERLIINTRYDLYDYNPYCGNVTLSIFANMEIRIKPGETSGNIRGESEASLMTDYCDWTSGWLTNSGTLRKID